MSPLHTHHYVPAAGHDWALPLYDPLLRLFRLDALRDLVRAGVELRPYQRVLDVGCGTGTLLTKLKRQQPALEVTGIDPDPKAVAIARKKAARNGVEVRLDEGFAGALPYPARSFDHVFSSFMFHHLDQTEKRAMLLEVLRVLEPGGHFHLLDFRDEPQHRSRAMRLLHVFSLETKIAGQREREVESMVSTAGFVNVALEVRRSFLFWAVATCRAEAPLS